jgi:protein-disulfide isomerase
MSGDPDSERCMQSAQLLVPVTERDHSIGPSNAVVTLVEYGDFECSFCRKAYSMIQGLRRYMADNLCFVYRHFPLAEAHPHAQHAAEAAEAAGAQGKFWEMHDILFQSQDALEDEDLVMYAARIGIDFQRVSQELAAGTYTRKVRDDFRGGARSGVNGTPTFFINGVRYDGNWGDANEFIQVLSDAASQVPAGAP